MSKKKDNSTLRHKVRLRLLALAEFKGRNPVVLETHGGAGRVFAEVYANITRGVVIEKDAGKAAILARQRPTWAVYEGDCEKALADGAGSHLPFDLIDIDPYGSPFKTIEAIFGHGRELPDTVYLVVNDGLRKKVRLGGAWQVGDLSEMVAEFGNNLFHCYLDVAKEKTRRLAGAAGYELVKWYGYYCGHNLDMTHYWAVLKRQVNDAEGPAPDSDIPAAGKVASRA